MNKLEGPFILVNPERCVGCHTCELACAAAHTTAGSIIGAVLAGERLHRRNRVVQVDSVKLSTQCRQCEDAPCVRVCPTGATYRTLEDGVVHVNRDVCVGCHTCVLACPYNSRFINPLTGTADKCDFCYHRITKGLETACVNACPFGARKMCNIKDINDPVTQVILNERVGVLKDEFGTKPQAFYIGLASEVR